MPSALEAARTGKPPAEALHDSNSSALLAKQIVHWLDEAKAEEIVSIDLAGKTSIGDFMIIASGRTDRHVGAIADKIQRKLKDSGHGRARVEGVRVVPPSGRIDGDAQQIQLSRTRQQRRKRRLARIGREADAVLTVPDVGGVGEAEHGRSRGAEQHLAQG